MTSQTNKIFFDTDCLSAFLWVNNESLLPILYPGKIVIPEQVYVELSLFFSFLRFSVFV